MKSKSSMMSRDLISKALQQSVIKLNPKLMARNPVMFVVEVGLIISLLLIFVPNAFGESVSTGFNIAVAIILLFTILFANFAEALAEGRGKAQADSMKNTQKEIIANRIEGEQIVAVSSTQLRKRRYRQSGTGRNDSW